MSKISAIKRYLFIIHYVREISFSSIDKIHSYVNEQLEMHEISDAISLKTIRRDIEDIKGFLGISIEYSTKERGYYIPFDENQSSVLEEILDSFEILNSIGADNGKPDYIIPEKRKPRGINYFTTVKKAIKDKKQILIQYKKYYPEITKDYCIEPQILKQSRNRWYCIGYDTNDSYKIKSFGLERIENITLLHTMHACTKTTDWNKEFEHCFAMFNTDDKPQKIVFECDMRDGQYIESMPIHTSQKITRLENKMRVELYLKITLDLQMELMSRAWSIQVNEPLSLRDDLRKIFEEAVKRNT